MIRNNHTAKIYNSVIQKLQLQKPRAVNDIMKKQDIEIDWAKFNSFSGNFIMNGFVHQGYCDDLLFNSHIAREADDANDQKGLENEDVNESQIVTAGAEVPTDKDQQQRLPQGHNLFIYQKFDPSKCDINTSVAAASLGLIYKWNGYQRCFDFC